MTKTNLKSFSIKGEKWEYNIKDVNRYTDWSSKPKNSKDFFFTGEMILKNGNKVFVRSICRTKEEFKENIKNIIKNHLEKEKKETKTNLLKPEDFYMYDDHIKIVNIRKKRVPKGIFYVVDVFINNTPYKKGLVIRTDNKKEMIKQVKKKLGGIIL